MKTLPRRIAVTGLGVVGPLGLSVDALWDSLLEGRCGITQYSLPNTDTRLPISLAGIAQFSGDIEDYGPLDPVRKKTIKKAIKLMSREIQMGLAAAQRSLEHAGIAKDTFEPHRVGISIGSDYIISTPEECFDGIRACHRENGSIRFSEWGTLGLPKMTPLWQLKYLPNMPASHVAICNEFLGPNNSITLREASIGAVIAESIHIIASGRADAMLVGATGSRIHPNRLVASLLQEEIVCDPLEPSLAHRPFDKKRSGTVPGEGAGMLLLEDFEHAEKRGANILAEIVSASSAAAIRPGVIGDPETALGNAIENVLLLSESKIDEIGHINAHGFGTKNGDVAEYKAIRRHFGEKSESIPLTSAKCVFGNLGAGGGAIELIAGIKALENNEIFPIGNYENEDPDCPVNAVRERGIGAGNTFLKLAYNHQGQASAILVRKT